jgi:hypothetical protein
MNDVKIFHYSHVKTLQVNNISILIGSFSRYTTYKYKPPIIILKYLRTIFKKTHRIILKIRLG